MLTGLIHAPFRSLLADSPEEFLVGEGLLRASGKLIGATTEAILFLLGEGPLCNCALWNLLSGRQPSSLFLCPALLHVRSGMKCLNHPFQYIQYQVRRRSPSDSSNLSAARPPPRPRLPSSMVACRGPGRWCTEYTCLLTDESCFTRRPGAVETSSTRLQTTQRRLSSSHAVLRIA